MLEEKRKIMIHRLFWLFILAITIFTPGYIIDAVRIPTSELEIVSDNCSTDYYSSLDETSCTVSITFNMDVTSGNAVVDFYDEDNELLERVSSTFIGVGDTAEDYISVNGKVDSYKIVSYDIEPEQPWYFLSLYTLYCLAVIPFIFFLATLTLNYKVYNFYGHKMIIYAGFYHHYIKIDGVIYDEYNSASALAGIHLSCTCDENLIETTISGSNSISTKINGKLVKPE